MKALKHANKQYFNKLNSNSITDSKKFWMNIKVFFSNKIKTANTIILNAEATTRRCSLKKRLLKNFTKFTEKHLCQNLFLNKVAGLRQLIEKETLGQLFS